jgi:hypothetical protein
MWIKLSAGVFLFGRGGVTRFETNNGYDFDGGRSPYLTVLYSDASKLTIVKESVEEILLKLESVDEWK